MNEDTQPRLDYLKLECVKCSQQHFLMFFLPMLGCSLALGEWVCYYSFRMSKLVNQLPGRVLLELGGIYNSVWSRVYLTVTVVHVYFLLCLTFNMNIS